MTGFGAAEGELGSGRLAVEVRAVNHRFFNPSIKLPTVLSRWESDAREVLRARVSRGHVTLIARLGTTGPDVPRIDSTVVAAYVAQLEALRKHLGLSSPVDLGSVVRLPNVIVSDEVVDSVDDPSAFLRIVQEAADAMDAMRVAEGQRLLVFVRERLTLIAAAISRVAERAPFRLVELRDRLRRNVRELAEGVAIDEQRVAQEVAILADRLDVDEEIHRFAAHLDAFRATLASPPPDGVGKRLGFLLQELLREANTTGSKANDSAMVNDVLLIKEELERVREQVENLE
ncbi:MAG TPA: YicC/YloC family endoribonuclease [Gemmatimonadaceae bacterium]|nr:YicC/YloC family endoribonuclease [Gemmatimonadaceae bacterium]